MGKEVLTPTSKKDSHQAIAVDFGGSKTIVALVDTRGEISCMKRAPTPKDCKKAMESITEMVEEVIEGCGRGGIEGIGMSVPGMADPARGVLIYAPYFRVRNLPVKEMMEDRFGLKTSIDNDVNACALGEIHFGHGRGYRNFIWITISNGVGGAIVVDGRLYRGGWGLAGEIGHVRVSDGGPECDCGGRGCLEVFVSGRAIAKRTVELLGVVKDSIIPSMVDGDMEKINPMVVAEAVKRGDGLARRIFDETGEYLGRAVSMAVSLLDPDAVILGGGVMESGGIILDPLKRTVERYTVTSGLREIRILPSALGYYASLIGASTLLFREMNLL